MFFARGLIRAALGTPKKEKRKTARSFIASLPFYASARKLRRGRIKRPREKCAARSFYPFVSIDEGHGKKSALRALFLRLFVDGEKRYAFRLGSARRLIVSIRPERFLNLNSMKFSSMNRTSSLHVLYNGSPRSSNRGLPIADRFAKAVKARKKRRKAAWRFAPFFALIAAMVLHRRRSWIQNRRPALVWRRRNLVPDRSRWSLKMRLDPAVRRLPKRFPYQVPWPWRRYFG